MTGIGTTLLEAINPSWVRRRYVPPLEAGFRPNQKLDEAEVLASGFEADDMVAFADGRVVVTHGNELQLYRDRELAGCIASFPRRIMAITALGDDVIAAVSDVGLMSVDPGGRSHPYAEDQRLCRCVTALHGLPDGSVVVTTGSARHRFDEWNRALVAGERSGAVFRLAQGQITSLADGLAWPAGIILNGDGHLLISIANDYRIDILDLDTRQRKQLLGNLPAYPGRMSRHDEGVLVAFPYVRNRLSELLLGEKKFVADMVETVDSDHWCVPRLANHNPHTSALQLGQLRVLGVLKPWAPAFSYGLLGVLAQSGRFVASYHSRADGSQHGVTRGIATADGLLVAVSGSRNLVLVKEA